MGLHCCWRTLPSWPGGTRRGGSASCGGTTSPPPSPAWCSRGSTRPPGRRCLRPRGARGPPPRGNPHTTVHAPNWKVLSNHWAGKLILWHVQSITASDLATAPRSDAADLALTILFFLAKLPLFFDFSSISLDCCFFFCRAFFSDSFKKFGSSFGTDG